MTVHILSGMPPSAQTQVSIMLVITTALGKSFGYKSRIQLAAPCVGLYFIFHLFLILFIHHTCLIFHYEDTYLLRYYTPKTLLGVPRVINRP